MADKKMFTLTPRFKAAINLINGIEVKKLPALLRRIVAKLHLKDEKPFTVEEEEQLRDVLSITANDVDALLDAASFIFEQAAYYTIGAQEFAGQLQKINLAQTHLEIFAKLWEQERPTVLQNLRDHSIVPKQLSSIGWRLHLEMAQSDLTRVKTPLTIFEFNLKDSDSTINPKAKENTFLVEFTHEELYKFFDQLDLLQEQLDRLS